MNDEEAVVWVPEVEVVIAVPCGAVMNDGWGEGDEDAVVITGE